MSGNPYSPEVLEAFRIIREGTLDEFQSQLNEKPTLLGEWGPSLMTYVAEHRADFLPALGTAKIDVNAPDIWGNTPLDSAAQEGLLASVAWLLEHGANPNQRRKNPSLNETPFFTACYKGHLEVVKLMIDHGADASVACWKPKQTCIEVAADEGHKDVVAFLESRGFALKKKVTSESNDQFTQMRKMIAAGAEKAFAKMRDEHPHEKFYAFALYSDGDASTVTCAACTEEAWQTTRQKHDPPNPSTLTTLEKAGITLDDYQWQYRWNTGEWPYRNSDEEEFSEVYDLINADDAYDEDATDGFAIFKAQVYGTMVMALLDLNDAGFFGGGRERREVTLFCDISDSSDALWLVYESARELNPVSTFDAFSLKYKACHSKEDQAVLARPKSQPLYPHFKGLLKQKKKKKRR